MPRITRKYLISWVNEKFKELEINEYEVYDVEPTRFSGHLLEGGAACLYIKFKRKGANGFGSIGTFYSFYKIRDIQDLLKEGYELFLNLNKNKYGTTYSLTAIELDLRKK